MDRAASLRWLVVCCLGLSLIGLTLESKAQAAANTLWSLKYEWDGSVVTIDPALGNSLTVTYGSTGNITVAGSNGVSDSRLTLVPPDGVPFSEGVRYVGAGRIAPRYEGAGLQLCVRRGCGVGGDFIIKELSVAGDGTTVDALSVIFDQRTPGNWASIVGSVNWNASTLSAVPKPDAISDLARHRQRLRAPQGLQTQMKASPTEAWSNYHLRWSNEPSLRPLDYRLWLISPRSTEPMRTPWDNEVALPYAPVRVQTGPQAWLRNTGGGTTMTFTLFRVEADGDWSDRRTVTLYPSNLRVADTTVFTYGSAPVIRGRVFSRGAPVRNDVGVRAFHYGGDSEGFTRLKGTLSPPIGTGATPSDCPVMSRSEQPPEHL